MLNADVARLFEELADLLELDGANSFRVRAYRNAARTIEGLSADIAAIVEREPAELQQLDGIGKDLADKIVVIVRTAQLPQLEELKAKIPAGVVQMLRIPGLGPKKVAALFKELGLETLDALQQAAEAGRIAELKGFGKKTEQSILEGLAIVAEAGQRALLADAKGEADAVVADLQQLSCVTQAEVAGSCRRRKETCGDLDVLATSSDANATMDRLAANPLVVKVLARGDTKQRVRLRSGLELDLRVVPDESFGAAMQYFTGSKEHNIVIRRRA